MNRYATDVTGTRAVPVARFGALSAVHPRFGGYVAGVAAGQLLGYLWYNPNMFGTVWAKDTYNSPAIPVKDVPMKQNVTEAYMKALLVDAAAGAALLMLPANLIRPSTYIIVAAIAAFLHLAGSVQGNFYKERNWRSLFIDSGYWALNILIKGFLLEQFPY